MAHDVFICYSSKDKTTADAVCAVLESEGIRCWIAPRDILVGMSYGEAIVDAIHQAKALVLVFSGHANASPQIEREVERAINKRIPVIPLRIEDVAPDKALEYFLSTPHWLDAFTPPLDRHLRNLAGQIRRLINMPDPAAAAAAAGLAAPAIGSPFKNTENAPTVAAPDTTAPPGLPQMGSAPEAKPPGGGNAALGAAAFPASGAGGAGGSVPSAKTKSGASAATFLNNLDTPQKIGIGAGILVLLIGVAWAISSNTGTPSYTPSPIASSPGPGPNGVDVTDNNRPNNGNGPTGMQGPSSSTPGGQQMTDRPPSGSNLPSDGNIVPGTTPAMRTADAEGFVNAATGSDLAAAMNEAGFDPQLSTDNQGDPMLKGSVQGMPFTVFFYRCTHAQPESCMDLQFHASFPNRGGVTAEGVNKYNRDNRFGQAYFDSSGNLGVDMSATLQGGVSREHIKGVLNWWKVTITNFLDKIGG